MHLCLLRQPRRQVARSIEPATLTQRLFDQRQVRTPIAIKRRHRPVRWWVLRLLVQGQHPHGRIGLKHARFLQRRHRRFVMAGNATALLPLGKLHKPAKRKINHIVAGQNQQVVILSCLRVFVPSSFRVVVPPPISNKGFGKFCVSGYRRVSYNKKANLKLACIYSIRIDSSQTINLCRIVFYHPTILQGCNRRRP